MNTPNTTGAVTALRAHVETLRAMRDDLIHRGYGATAERAAVQAAIEVAASPPEDAPAVDGGDAVETQAEQSDRRAFPMGYDSHLHGLVTDNVASALLCCGIDYLPAGVLDTIASEIVRSYYAVPPEPEWAGDLILAHKTALEAFKSENPPKTLFAGIEQDLRRVMIALWGRSDGNQSLQVPVLRRRDLHQPLPWTAVR